MDEGPRSKDPADPDSVVLVTALGDEPLAPLVLARHVGAGSVVCVGRPVVDWRVEPLLRLLHREKRRATWLPLDAVDVPHGLAELERVIPATDGALLVFDLTNARGVVGIALYELARRRERERQDGARLLRIDWSDRLVRSVSPDDAATEPLGAALRLADFLELHGKRLLGVERATGSRGAFGQAAHRIARGLSTAQPLLEAVHRGGPDKPLRVRQAHASDELVSALVDDGVLIRLGRAVAATDLRAFQFLHGRWLEEYLFEIADDSGRFDDCASGVRFSWTFEGDEAADGEEGPVANEIDFAGTAGGRATVASCKTGFRDVAGPLYELLTLAERAAGRSVVSVFATSAQLDRPARHRAAALGIRVLDAERLADPARVLAALLGEPRPRDGHGSGTMAAWSNTVNPRR